MKAKQPNKSKEYQRAAKSLFNEVSRLTARAGKTLDQSERYKLYIQAMGLSNKAYELLGKAKELTGKLVSNTKDKLETERKLECSAPPPAYLRF